MSQPRKGDGLIRTPALQIRYQEATKPGALEEKTKHLWQELLIGTDSPLRLVGYSLNSEVRPSQTSGRECDLAISYVTATATDIRVLAFIECKKESIQQFSGLENLEKQVLRYGMDYLEEKKQPYIYLMTVRAAHARLFQLTYAKDKPRYLWGQAYVGDIKEYYNIAEAEDAKRFSREWSRMLQSPPTTTLDQQIAHFNSPATSGTDLTRFHTDVELYEDPTDPTHYLYKFFARIECESSTKWTNQGGTLVNEERGLFAANLQKLDQADAVLNEPQLRITSGRHKGQQLLRNRCHKAFWRSDTKFRLYYSLDIIKVVCKVKED